MAHCETIKLPGGGTAIVRFSGIRQPRCHVFRCGNKSQYQCDFVLNRNLAGEPIRTCDRHLCGGHVRHWGEGVDYCSEHFEIISK